MLLVNNVSKSYGDQVVLDQVSFHLSSGERAGLVGPNGAGKSTLLRLIAGVERPDSGTTMAGDVAYLPQYPEADLDRSIRSTLRQGAGEAGAALEEVEWIESALPAARDAELDRLLVAYGEARDRVERLGGYDLDARIDRIVAGLRLDAADLHRPVRSLSGGNKTKLSLARLLLADASLLLLDEPTNYLDLPALLWLEQFLGNSARTCLIVSHDRRFLDRTTATTISLEPATHGVRVWAGSYSAYEAQRRREEEKRLAAYADQETERKRIEAEIRRIKETAQSLERQTRSGGSADYYRGIAKGIARKAKVRERRLEKALARPDRIEKPVAGWNLHLTDLGPERIADDRLVVSAEDLSAGYDGRSVLRGLGLDLRGRDRLALLGTNGSGKSTLLRCLTGALPYTGTVRWGPSIRPGILSQEAEELPLGQTVLSLARRRTAGTEGEIRSYLHKFLFAGDEVHKSVSDLSYGQRAKLALALLILGGANVLLLDEPTVHLDIPALEAVEEAVAAFPGPLMVVSHDRAFLAGIGITRWAAMGEGRLEAVRDLETYEASLQDGVPGV